LKQKQKPILIINILATLIIIVFNFYLLAKSQTKVEYFFYSTLLPVALLLYFSALYLKSAEFLKILGVLIGLFIIFQLVFEYSFSIIRAYTNNEDIQNLRIRINSIAAITILLIGFHKLIIALLQKEYSANNENEISSRSFLPIKKILDTSVIIDGRIVDLCKLKFIEGEIIIPKFILKELQAVADSQDNLKRNRGRRGLDNLNQIQNIKDINLKIIDNDYPELKEADEKLIKLAAEINAALITNDYNLNKIAELHNIVVINLNDLANALKPVLLPGEQVEILIVKEGKEHNQGIGYLNDGTMVVIDNANKLLNQKVSAIVTSTIQTSAGRMIFGKKPEDLKN